MTAHRRHSRSDGTLCGTYLGLAAGWRIGLASGLPEMSPMRAAARVPLSNPLRPSDLLAVLAAAPNGTGLRASRPALRRSRAGSSAGARLCRPRRRRERPRGGALNLYRKFSPTLVDRPGRPSWSARSGRAVIGRRADPVRRLAADSPGPLVWSLGVQNAKP